MTMKSTRSRRRTRAAAVSGAVLLTFALTTPAVLAAETNTPGAINAASELPAYKNTALPFEVRAADLVSRMTRAEKIEQFRAERQQNSTIAPAIDRLGVPAYNYWNEALHGIARADESNKGLNNGGEATEFPTGLGIAATWNPDLVKAMASAASDEARAMHNFESAGVAAAHKGLTYWSPTINMLKDPRWGRAEETYGEDPFLTSVIGGQFVDGLQGDHETYLKTAATPKHYLANSSETNRHTGSSNLTEAELREYYTPAFADLVGKHGAGSLMTSYNAVNGTPVSASKEYVETLARRTFGFNGTVTSDCDAVRDVWQPQNHNWGPDGTPLTAPQAVAWTLKTGVDLDCMDGDYPKYLETSFQEGNVTEADMEASLVRTFTIRMRTGEFDGAGATPWDNYTLDSEISADDHLATSRQMSDEAAVLLRNEQMETGSKLLPFDATKTDSVVVVGPLATTEVHGDYSPSAIAERSNALQGIEKAVAAANPNAKVTYIPGMNKSGLENKRKPQIGASVEGSPAAVRFLDAAGNELGRVAPETILRNESYSGWRSIQPWWPITDRLVTQGAWGGWFSVTTNVPEGTAHVEVVQQGADTTLEEGRFDIRIGAKNAEAIGSVEALGSTASTDYTGPTGEQTIFFTYENDSFVPLLSEEEQQTIENADAVVAYVGTIAGNNSTYPLIEGNPSDSSEDEDRDNIDLPRGQDKLINTVSEMNPNTVAWIQAISQIDVESFKDSVAGLVWTTYNGMYQGDTVGRVLFGQANPSAKLPFTQYSDIDQLADPRNYTMTPTDGLLGRSYQYFTGDVTYPFGFGLSYSTFEYSNLALASTSVDVNGELTATVDVTNTSDVDGAEVVQLYVSSPSAADPYRPDSQLKAFKKVNIAAGATEKVELKVKASDLWFWDTDNARKTYENGTWQIWVGPSSAKDTALASSFELTGSLTPAIGVVAVVPDGVALNTAVKGNAIHANLSATRNDDSFYDLSDPAVKVTYTSSDPKIAVVDAQGTVTPVAEGVAQITATVAADGTEKSATFPVIVRNGAVTDGDVTINDFLVDFADQEILVEDAQKGVRLNAELTPSGNKVAYTYRVALNEENSAGATVTADGILTASKPGTVRVTVLADSEGMFYSHTATVKVVEKKTEPVVPPVDDDDSDKPGDDSDVTYQPAVVVDDEVVVHGQKITITGSGFVADKQIDATFHSDPVTIGSAQADGKGGVVFTFTIPENAELGAHEIRLVQPESGLTAKVDLQVVRADDPAASDDKLDKSDKADKSDSKGQSGKAGKSGKGKGKGLAVTGANASAVLLVSFLLSAVGLGAVALRRRLRD
ncbi:glycoside hydrolase family 3 N-terminal domain-containing protein [Schaalia vaccimaxillae]|uniref:glycoside hydrolase family 3 N-terminal domain-containing protein n=1 Tax=Schaalia vaccimaxillae TaxID=183916 RepID=UPI0003B3C647|nr:glycoside hydrolase family 3 N-terminal domain-containing protein [Schaalia vaccimaxillae]